MDLRLHPICTGLVFVVLPAGVMATGLDGDLVGVVAAAVVIGVLLVILIGIMAYCCFRRMETKRTSMIPRKDSTTTLTVTPSWQPNTHPTFPVFNVAEPMSYSQPYYYLGDYRPKYVGVEPLQYIQPYMLEGRRHVPSHHHEKDDEHDVENTTIAHKVDGPSQPNGHAVHDFSASSLNYRVIRKQHQHMKMPDWLTKSYGESKASMDVGEEGSRTSSIRLALTSGLEDHEDDPIQAARIQVSPRNSTLDTHELLHFSDDFTIIDYVDPDRGPPRTRSAGNRQATVVTTTTTFVEKRMAVNTSTTSTDGQYVPPASSSTPRAPPVMVGVGDEDGGLAPVSENADFDYHRQRKTGEGSIAFMPESDNDVPL